MTSGHCPASGVQPPSVPEWADGGDSPAWSRKRSAYQAPSDIAWRAGTVPYAELHCHTNFSFLDGASHPEELAEEAARLGLEALAVTDHDGFYGVVRFAEAARATGLPTVFGTELTLDGPTVPPLGAADPPGEHLVLLQCRPDRRERGGRVELCRWAERGPPGAAPGRCLPNTRASRR